jgi:hypothetical protein
MARDFNGGRGSQGLYTIKIRPFRAPETRDYCLAAAAAGATGATAAATGFRFALAGGGGDGSGSAPQDDLPDHV